MLERLFLLGRPGCGKSSAAKQIQKLAENKGWDVERVRDFDILEQMYIKDKQGRFKPSNYNGFDVLDETVLDEALDRLNEKLFADSSDDNAKKAFLIEFARADYIEAFKRFSKEILQNAHFLFIDANLDVCKERIRRRMQNPILPDDHYVSDETLERFYKRQVYPTGKMVINSIVIESSNFIDNNRDSLPEFMRDVNNFVDDFFNFK